MTVRFLFGMTLVLILLPALEAAERTVAPVELPERLAPLHQRMGEPKPGEWLYVHGDEEKGQTFKQYIRYRPIRPTRSRDTIVIQPLGEFTKEQRKVMALTTEFMGLYYDLPVRVEKDKPLSVIPDSAKRVHPTWGDKQILTTYVLDDMLRPNLPRDAAVYICITSSDLWPGGEWNFVFGQASLRWRVGVQSLYRNGDPGESEDAFSEVLLRTIKTAVHETGHMFSMHHCIEYECCMNGSNSRPEADGKPLWLCPECVAKVCWVMNTDPAKRYENLAHWCLKQGFRDEAAFYAKSAGQLGLPVALPKAKETSESLNAGDRVRSQPVDPVTEKESRP